MFTASRSAVSSLPLMRRAGGETGFAAFALALLIAGCGDKPITPASRLTSSQILQRNCADPQWREQHLWLWNSFCNQPYYW